MNWTPAEAIARAILYEGYLLYPYRPSALKNRRRAMFGTVEADGSPGPFAQCLIEGSPETALSAKFRFLQELPAGTEEREVLAEGTTLGALRNGGFRREFEVPPGAGSFELGAEPVGGGFWKITLRIENRRREPDPSAAFLSGHVLLGAQGGAFVSATDPGDRARLETELLSSRGLWPVLVGTPPDRSLMLAAPVILPDYPSVAEESPNDLFDLTEIDEILSLRILTLSEAEREEVRAGDGRARQLLERTDALSPAELLALHGRATRGAPAFPKQGDLVRLRPRGRADIMDLALDGREATVVAIEVDLEGRRYVAVTVKDDPGSDLGELGFLGHRFFFRPEEVEPV